MDRGVALSVEDQTAILTLHKEGQSYRVTEKKAGRSVSAIMQGVRRGRIVRKTTKS